MNPSQDGSLEALYTAQWVQPVLVPILDACLSTGDLFVDVGANVGVYSTWAARLVTPQGKVLALEPVDTTRRWLEEICSHNALHHVEVLATAAGAADGRGTMATRQRASGLARLVPERNGDLEVPITTLDRLLDSLAPALIKIDVEGSEMSVLEGAAGTLERTCAPVVFEAPEFGAGTGVIHCVTLLESLDYHTFSLTPSGIRSFDPSGFSHNLLALHRSDNTIEERLQGSRFARSQNT